jgi:type IV pilus assembly protein PilA
MIQRIRQRLDASSAQGGFTLIELLVVIVIIGILLAIAVPSYLGFRERANDSAAQSNVRAALPAVEAYFADNGTYAGMDLAALQAIDQNVSLDGDPDVTATTYCIQSTVGGQTWSISGPGSTTPTEASC